MKVVEKLIRTVTPRPYREDLLLTYRARVYKGTQLECPCCEGKFNQFFPFGNPPRNNAQCPGCNSLERHRTLWFYLKEKTTLFTAQQMLLHFAPETIYSKHFSKLENLNYITADLCSPKAKYHFDIQEIPLPDHCVDSILCNHVLEHVENDIKALSELYRVLKPGGWAILQVPLEPGRQQTLEDPNINTPALRAHYYGQDDHLRMYGLDYADRLQAAGFHLTIDSFCHNLPLALIQRHHLVPEDVYLCKK